MTGEQLRYRLVLSVDQMDADRCWHGGHVPGWLQRPGIMIDPDDDHRVRILVCHQQQGAGWIDDERAGAATPRRFVPNQRQLAGLGVNGIDRQAVVPGIEA